MQVTKQDFLKNVWRLLEENNNISVLDAIIEISDRFLIDPETVGKIISSNQQLKLLLEQQSRKLHLLVN